MAPQEAKPTKFTVSFLIYLKHLTSLKLRGIHDADFAETMFEMYSARKLKSLSLGLASD